MSLVLMGMNGRDVGGRLIAGRFGYSGLLAMTDKILEILNSAHRNECDAE